MNRPFLSHNACSLWMGDIEEFMDERFIKTSFNLLGAKVSHVKVVRNKMTGQPLGYGFVSFENEESAQRVLRELNGKQIPNASEGKKFRLNNTSSRENDSEYSIYVGELTPEVDDYTLFAAFAAHYPSTCSAKVMYNEGQSKGYGFVRFNTESDYRSSLIQCQNNVMVGSKAITVRAANPRRSRREHYKRSAVVSQESIPQVSQSESQEVIYASDANAYYNYAANPYWCYGYMSPYNTGVQYGQYDYAYGQQLVAQQYYPYCDNVAYPLMASQSYVDHGQSQFLDSDKLNDETIAKNEVCVHCAQCARTGR